MHNYIIQNIKMYKIEWDYDMSIVMICVVVLWVQIAC